MNHLAERVGQFSEGVKILTEWLYGGAVTVDPATAQRRADVCLKCPMNVHESFTAETIAAAIRKQVEIKNHLQLRVEGEKSLHTCTACGCVTRLKIWVPLERILPDADEMPNFHESCWLKTESKK